MQNEELKYYHAHPSALKTHKIETTPLPLKEQVAPYEAKALVDSLRADIAATLPEYEGKRFEITGVAIKVGPDIHNKPSIELSDSVDGQCCALCIFRNSDHYSKVSVGDVVTIRANYLVMSNLFGIVMKLSELLNVKKGN